MEQIKEEVFRLIYLYSKMRVACNAEVLHGLMSYFQLEDIETAIAEMVSEEKIFITDETILPN